MAFIQRALRTRFVLCLYPLNTTGRKPYFGLAALLGLLDLGNENKSRDLHVEQ
jgi:hypothetical protein